MINERQVWRSIFEFIKYTGYEYFTHNADEEDIWLIHRKKGSIKRIVFRKETAQATLFMVQKVIDHFDDIEMSAGVQIKDFEIILVNQTNQITNDMPLNIHVKECNDKLTLDKLLKHHYNAITNKYRDKPVNTYKRLVLNDNVIEKATRKFSPITYILILVNIIVFIYTFFWNITHKVDLAIEKGGLTHFNFVHGDYYRIITSIFLHFDIQHLIFNMMSLFIFGKFIEYYYRKWQYLCIYIGGGIIGNLISLTFDNASVSVGASGAICALIGAFIIYLVFSSKFDKRFILQSFIGVCIFLGASAIFENVNHFAHFGGLFGGMIIATLYYVYQYRTLYFYIMIAGIVIITILLLLNIFSEKEHHIYNEYAKAYMIEGNDDESMRVIRQTIDKGYDNDETYILYGLVKTKQESLSKGLLVWLNAIKKFPDSDRLNYQLALTYRSIDDYQKAEKYINKAIVLNEKDEYIQLKKEIKKFR
ncbi:rhomboid family protein [Macrococcus armenti]|uniref:rhomboid family protein n=1 Tax=Macrococcus armenti TaxID=2875764 RepID=UPI001CC9CE53|nr:rhomboid family intramembrane serine protease [Macrococcus armenti]UBH14481.1 rhomboid family intramembrane serine protease [Macrococcus armenti]UBH16842.1 rhomboid family intramembrane serine protease [Macrococcus armenti]UBH19104.1 rhomboid family intramembrane serine protease [Macrococcus armenti]